MILTNRTHPHAESKDCFANSMGASFIPERNIGQYPAGLSGRRSRSKSLCSALWSKRYFFVGPCAFLRDHVIVLTVGIDLLSPFEVGLQSVMLHRQVHDWLFPGAILPRAGGRRNGWVLLNATPLPQCRWAS